MADTVEHLERSRLAPWTPLAWLETSRRAMAAARRTVRVRPPSGPQAAAMRLVGMAIRCALMPVEVLRRS